ncbi:MAG: hypothetical protein IKA72_01895 [Clostridia bacterium]|nr:hypothetical protein [Clostridia bacterium]
MNLTLPDKGMVFILGRSGSGKSTLNDCNKLNVIEKRQITLNKPIQIIKAKE